MQQLRKFFHYKYSDLIVLLGSVGVFIGLVSLTLTKWSIWFDEAFSAYIVRFNPADIATLTASDVHPPLYYWALKLWTSLFGTSDLAFRSLSVLFAVVIIVIGFFLVRKLFGRKAAWLSILFLVLSPVLLRFAQEARMYTMVISIALAATYVLIKAQESQQKRWWVIYGLLVAAGMWTHYFVAVVWIAHWVWRGIILKRQHRKFKKFVRAFFSKAWIWTHVLAVATFLPWLPFMASQLGIIQGTGFWIGPVTADSVTNFFTTTFLFLQHDHTFQWAALLFMLALGGLLFITIQAYRLMNRQTRDYFTLLLCLVVVPVGLIFVASLPPLKSSFIERYMMTSTIIVALVAAVALVYSVRKKATIQLGVAVVIITAFIVGQFNVNYLGNFNKSSNMSIETKQLVADVASRSSDGEAIIARSPWIFYEAVFYETPQHPIYYLDASVQGDIGSLAMLQRPDSHSIKNLEEFATAHPTVWYIGDPGNDEIQPPVKGWKKLQEIRIDDRITGQKRYQAVQYQTN